MTFFLKNDLFENIFVPFFFLEKMEGIIEKMSLVLLYTINTNEISEDQKSIFEEISLKNSNSFLLYDQINKKFGSEIFIIDQNILKTAINFEVEKIKRYLKAIETLEKLEGYIYIFSVF